MNKLKKLFICLLLAFGLSAMTLNATPASAAGPSGSSYVNFSMYATYANGQPQYVTCTIGFTWGTTIYGYPYIQVADLGYGHLACNTYNGVNPLWPANGNKIRISGAFTTGGGMAVTDWPSNLTPGYTLTMAGTQGKTLNQVCATGWSPSYGYVPLQGCL